MLIFRFFNNSKFSWKIEKIIFPTFKNFNHFKIWDRSLIAMLNLHVTYVENQSVLSWKLYLWRRLPRTLIFLPKSWEHVVTLTSFTADLSEPWKIILARVCKSYAGRGMQSLVAISYFVFFFSYEKKSGGGRSPPPSGRGLMDPKLVHSCIIESYLWQTVCLYGFTGTRRINLLH